MSTTNFLHPPLTFFKPLGKTHTLAYEDTDITVVTVRPTFPS